MQNQKSSKFCRNSIKNKNQILILSIFHHYLIIICQLTLSHFTINDLNKYRYMLQLNTTYKSWSQYQDPSNIPLICQCKDTSLILGHYCDLDIETLLVSWHFDITGNLILWSWYLDITVILTLGYFWDLDIGILLQVSRSHWYTSLKIPVISQYQADFGILLCDPDFGILLWNPDFGILLWDFISKSQDPSDIPISRSHSNIPKSWSQINIPKSGYHSNILKSWSHSDIPKSRSP
jgi:hypothetical protein